MCQDSLGYLWFGTADGACRYDGSEFETMILPYGPDGNFVNAFFAGSDSSVSIATNGGGLVKWKQGIWSRRLVNPETRSSGSNRVNCLEQLADNRFILGTDDGLFLDDGSSFVPFSLPGGQPERVISAIKRDPSGKVWIGTEDGLYVADPTAQRSCTRVDAFNSVAVASICSGIGDTMWIGTDHGLRCLRWSHGAPDYIRRVGNPFREADSLSVRSLLTDDQNTLWVGTDADGLFERRAGRLSHWSLEAGLPANRVLALFEDREHIVWICTTAGVGKLSARNVLNYTQPGKFARTYISAVAADRKGHIWAGSQQGIMEIRGDRVETFSGKNGLLSDYVLSLAADTAGNLWVGTTQGLNCLAPGERKFSSPAALDHLRGRRVRSLFMDHEGVLWIGWDRGVSAWSHGFVSTFRFADSVRSALVVGLIRDRNGMLWAGTEGNGLFQFSVRRSPGSRLILSITGHYDTSDGLTDENIRSLMEDREGRLWVGTRTGGMNVLTVRADSVPLITSLIVDRNRSGSWVRASMQDKGGNVWIATNRGVAIVGTDGQLRTRLQTDLLDMAGDDAYGLCEGLRGNIWIAASNGITRFDPSGGAAEARPPPVYITRFQIFGADDSSALQRGAASLGPDQHSVAFEFVGLSSLGAVRYRYMLEGLDSTWNEPTLRRYVNYTHLPPASYRFRVIACNAAGQWSIAPAAFSFEIAAPFWARWWFIGIAFLIILAGAHALDRLRMHRIVEMEHVRSRIAADLHDDIGSTLSSISVFSKVAEEEALHTAPETAEILRRIGSNAQAMLESLDEIVWIVKPGNDTVENIVLRIREYATQLCEAANIHFIMDVPTHLEGLRMSLEDRRQLYLIAKEAIHNIVKHSACSDARITLGVHGKELSLLIQDNGKGFQESVAPAGDGLENMRRRAAAMKGRLRLESLPGSGTKIVMHAKLT